MYRNLIILIGLGLVGCGDSNTAEKSTPDNVAGESIVDTITKKDPNSYSREEATAALGALIIEEGSKIQINGADVAPIILCLEGNGFGRSGELGFVFDLDPNDNNTSIFKFDYFWRNKMNLENPAAAQQLQGFADFDIPVGLGDIKVTGIASTENPSNKIVEYTAKINMAGQSFACLDLGIPISGRALAERFDDGWRVAFDPNAYRAVSRF